MSSRRRLAREAALQILYFWEVGRTAPETAIDSYFAAHQPDAPESVRSFTARLVHGTIAEVDDLDRVIARHATHWRVERLSVIDRLVLRLAVWELGHEPATPPAAVVNEALELARRFSGEEAVRFVNGVLDAVMKRPTGPAAPAP